MKYLRFSWDVVKTAVQYSKVSLGRALREAGLDLDRRGSILQRDVAFLQPINRHRNILNIQSYTLAISRSVHIAPNATVYGDVFIAQDSYVGFGAVVDGLYNPVRIGANTKIGDNSTIQSAFWVPDQAFPLSTTIGNNVNIEHSCNINNAIIDDSAHIGFRTVIMEGAQIERGVVVAPNSYVPAGSILPTNTLWAGNPVAFVKNLSQKDRQIQSNANERVKVKLVQQEQTL